VRRHEIGVRVARGSDRLSDVLGDALIDALAGAADGIFVTDREGGILLWNAAAEAMLGYTAAEALGRLCCTLLRGAAPNGNALHAPPCALGRNLFAPTPSFEMPARAKEGLDVRISVSVLTVADRQTRGVFVVHLFRDIAVGEAQLPLAHEGQPSAASSGPATTLTRREREVLRLMGDGLNTAAMARRLQLSRATIRNHVQNILLKLDVHSRLEAVALGRRRRLL
jgi:DNA-binding CsgD family transcriptional regulator